MEEELKELELLTQVKRCQAGNVSDLKSTDNDQVEIMGGKPGVSEYNSILIEAKPKQLQSNCQNDTNETYHELSYKDILQHTNENVYIEILHKDGKVNLNVCNVQVQGQDRKLAQACWGFDILQVCKAQKEDTNLRIILDWLEKKEIPNERDLFLASPASKSYWLNKEQFVLIEGLLYRERRDEHEKDLVVPETMKQEALGMNHDLPSAGHQGMARTKERVKEKFYWYGIGKDISNYVATCAICNKNKKSELKGRFPMQEYQASAPMERVHLDFLGPLPKTPSGNEHVLMMVDQFTKWVECIPLASQTAEVTAKAAVDHFFSRFGYPFQVFSDQGRNFESRLFTSLCEALEIHKTRTTSYRPSSNGQVERFNRTLMDAVRCYIGDSQDKWDLHLQQIAGALRSSVNRSTGFTANRLMLGREINSPAYLMFPMTKPQAQSTESYVATLMSNIQAAHNTARNQLNSSLKRMKRDYDLRILQRPYKEGDMIYLLDTATIKGKCKKLSSPWKGPAIVIKKISDSLFRVKLRKSIFVVNHDRMKPCKDRDVPNWITQWLANPVQDESNMGTETYCICKQPWQGRFMIQCDTCNEWFHGSCINVTASDALQIDAYICESCKD